ncbi:MAG TPA: hypothetical protein VK961_06085 [Chthoniobacter sp.]|nr:hypothetical protein [Chthoniobacter sp.]
MAGPALSLPTERLAIGVHSDEDDPDFLRFLIDPAAYIAGLPGVTVRNVAYIMPGGESPPDALQEPPQFLPDSPDGFVDTRKADDHAGEPDPSLRQRAEGPRIHQVESKSPFTVAGLWEFCFYNPLRQDQAATLRARVGSIYCDFIGRPESDRDYKAFIDRLKPLFAQVFGESGRACNDISLIAYSGPIRAGLEHACLSIRGNPIFPVNTSSRAWSREDLVLLDGWYCGWNGLPSESVGILLTGDITMSGALGAQLREHFRAPRWREIAILQAPHHGSKHSWELGAEGLWDQAWTVFSAGRFNDFGHPDRLVVSDLANRGPLFVDEYVGAHWIGCAQWKA